MLNSTTEERPLKIGDVIQIKADENIPTEIIGCLGYVMNPTNVAAIEFRVYQPKTIGENAEFSEYSLPAIALNFVGTVPADMQPL